MDNHRAALWCWLQALDLNKPHSLFHIDRHYDALGSRMEQWLKHLPDWSAGIDDYLSKSYRADFGKDYPTMRWDNYISIYLHEFRKNLTTFHCLTHEEGDKPKFDHIMYGELWELPENLVYWLTENENDKPWIVNIDLDYFYCKFENDSCMMVSDDYIDTVAYGLQVAMEKGVIGVLTICLTPGPWHGFTPGWPETEALAARLLKYLGLTFTLPDSSI